MASKRKTTTAIVAGVSALALLLGGTFAWTSISQQATNESAGIVNVGGRLHDDFDGTNKDVYVENFTDPLNGGQPIYARVKLTEYMEVGQDAGSGAGVDGDNDGKIEAVPVIAGTTIDNDKDWKVFIPGTITGTEITCGDCNEENGLCGIHDHWKWTVSGGKTYMPTFNKDKDSLAADINGTYHGTDDTDKVYYDDYVVYTTTEEDGVNNNIAEADKEAYEGEIYSVIGTEYYDDDTDTDDNGGTRQEENVTHTAKQTATAEVMTMAEWLQNPVAGNFWVYDEDGWAYWANPIMPGEATGLLLDGIEMYQNPGEKCYYAINVVGQFATVNDWEYFDNWDSESNAAKVMAAAVANVPTVTVTNESGVTLVNLATEEPYDFSAVLTVNGNAVDADFEWLVLDANGKVSEASTVTDGKLTVGGTERNENLIVVAKVKSGEYTGAVGMRSVAVNIPSVAVRSQDNITSLYPGETLQFAADVILSGEIAETDVQMNWSVTDSNGNPITTSSVNESGQLTVGDGEERGTVLKIVGESVKYPGLVDSMEVTVADKFIEISATNAVSSITSNSSATFTGNIVDDKNLIDPNSTIEWKVTDASGQAVDGVAFSGNVLNFNTTADDGEEFLVTATVKDEDGNTLVDGDYNFFVGYRLNLADDMDALVTASVGDKVTIDNNEWWVVKREGKTALLWSTDVIKENGNAKYVQFSTTSVQWEGSNVQTYLNGEYLSSLTSLSQYAEEHTFYTAPNTGRSGEYIESTDKVFVFSQADILGYYTTHNSKRVDTFDTKEYTFGEKIIQDNMIVIDRMYLTRSPGYTETGIVIMDTRGAFSGYSPKYTSSHVIRPVIGVDIGPITE